MLKQKACLQLDSQCFKVLFLSCQKEKITEGKRVKASEILFPRHLFVNMKEEQMLFSLVKCAKWSADFIRFGGPFELGPQCVNYRKQSSVLKHYYNYLAEYFAALSPLLK